MLQILSITGPIYIVIAMGYLAGRYGVFSRDDMRVLGRFVINFALPAMLFTALSQQPVEDILNARYLAAYLLGSLLMLGGGAWYMVRWRQKSRTLGVLSGMGMSCSNSGFIGYPIALQLLGPTAAVALALCMIVENLLMLPLALALADGGGGHAWHRVVVNSLARLLRNPIILAILAGFAVAFLEIQLSEPLARTVNMLALASTSLALFVIGGSLVGLEMGDLMRDAGTVAVCKLLLHPLAVFLMMWLIAPADPKLRTAGVLYAGMPMLSIYPILAQRYHHEGFSAAALLVATTLSFVTITAILWLMKSVLGWTG